MIPVELMAAKVATAVAARRNPDFLVIGRTNAVRASTMDDALRRGEAYRKAGADVLLLSMANTSEQLRLIGERLGGPLMYLAGRGGLAGLGMTLADLGALGFRIVADPSTPLLAAFAAWKKVYADLTRVRRGPAEGGLGPARARDAGGDRARETARSGAPNRRKGVGKIPWGNNQLRRYGWTYAQTYPQLWIASCPPWAGIYPLASFSTCRRERPASRDRSALTFRSDTWSARISFFDFVRVARYATQSSRSGVPRHAMVSPLSRSFRRPSTFASGLRLACMDEEPSEVGTDVSSR
jgi:hypothetical protein